MRPSSLSNKQLTEFRETSWNLLRKKWIAVGNVVSAMTGQEEPHLGGICRTFFVY